MKHPKKFLVAMILSLSFFGMGWGQLPAVVLDDAGGLYTVFSDGAGGFSGWNQIDNLGSNSRGIAMGYFNADPYPDLVVGRASGNTGYLYQYNGTASGFGPRQSLAPFSASLSSYIMDMAAGDFNEDDVDDFILGSNTGTVMVYLSNGSGGFDSHTYSWNGYGRGIDAGDFDLDGHLDIVRAEYSSGYVRLYKGDGAGNFTLSVTIGDAGSDPYGTAAADFNNDGYLDVLSNEGSSGNLTLWKGNGNGTFQAGVTPTGGDVNNHGGIDAYDYNGDGNADLIVTNYTGRKAFYCPGTGDGNFGAFTELGSVSTNTMGVAAIPYKNPIAPRALINPAEQILSAGAIAHLDGTGSIAPVGSILTWEWQFGDGQHNSGSLQDHTYTAKGIYWPHLKVTGSNGLFDQAAALVTVNGAPPQANAGGPYVLGEDHAQQLFWTGTLDGRGTLNDGGQSAAYVWNFMPDVSFSEDFSAGTLDGAKWRSANTNISGGTLLVGAASLGGWGSAYLESQENFTRREGMTLYLRFKPKGSENIMFGLKNTSDNHDYGQLYYAFYHANSSLYIYESGSSRGSVRGLGYGNWYDFKIELGETGARYFCKPEFETAWELLYQSNHVSGSDFKIGFSGYQKGNHEIDDIYLGNIQKGPQVTRTFHNIGTFPVLLTVTDFQGQSSTDTTHLTTQAGAPPAASTGGPYLFDESKASSGQWIAALDASASADDHGIWKYDWNFGDGATGSGVNPSHAYTGPGPHTVSLVVTDHAGLTATDQTIVNFSSGQPPIAAFSAPAVLDESAASQGKWTASFNASGSTDDHGIWKYEWNFGDGGTGSGVSPSHAFSAVGSYTVTLTVFDHAGQTHQTTRQLLVIANNPPLARITGPSIVDEGQAQNQHWNVTFSSSTSSDDYGLWKYQWNFGDGGTSTSAAPAYQYTATGTYTVQLTVWDHANQTSTVSHQIAVGVNDPPAAAITAVPGTVEGRQRVSLSGAGSTDDYGINMYRWDLGSYQYDFTGTAVDPQAWVQKGNVQQNGKLIFSGSGAWGQTYAYTTAVFGRPSEFTALIQTPAGSQNAMAGFKDLTDNGEYRQIAYAFYFNNGSLYVYESGSSRGRLSTYTAGNAYEIMITLGETAGAVYKIREAGAAAWTTVYTSTYAYSGNVCFGMDVYTNTFEIQELEIQRRQTGMEVTSTFNQTTNVALTVTDHGGQENTALKQVEVITANPPTAVISGPASYSVGLHAPFNGDLSSDDYAIASYLWNFGDGSDQAWGSQVSHAFVSGGNYNVRLTVTDFAGQSHTDVHLIEIDSKGLVRCVPWQIVGGTEIPHDTWDGKEITLKAVASTAALPFDYTWDFGDGSPQVSGTVSTRDASYKIEVKHAYFGSLGTPYTATLNITDAAGQTDSDEYRVIIRDINLAIETNVAIDEGLWYLHKSQIQSTSGSALTGYWPGYSGYYMNAAASSVQAFEISGHLESGDVMKDPYVETVMRGMNYLFSRLTYANISVQAHGNPDANGNGIGITVPGQQIYELGAVMDGIIASGTPHSIAQIGGTNVKGRTYADIVQDMADMYAWGQVDDGGARGGWRYSWNSGSDNSAAQWGPIGMIPAERIWGITVPQFVKDENQYWLNYSYSNGSFGYTGTGHNHQTTPSGMVQLSFNGSSTGDSRWMAAESRMAGEWNSFLNNNTTYGYFAFAKAMRTATPQPVVTFASNGFDWYNDDIKGLRRTLVSRQQTNGAWLSSFSYPREYSFNTAWTIIVLTPTLFEKPPMAMVTASPNPAAVGQLVTLDGSRSYHLDPFRSIASYAWDFDASDGIDWDNPDATGPVLNRAFGELRNYTVTLRVGDDRNPAIYDVATIVVQVTIPPHPPTAVPGGPYRGVVGEPVSLDGSGSFDVDEPEGDAITAWGWEIDFEAPRDFDDAQGSAPDVVYHQEGTFNIGLRVTDNTAVIFPQTGSPNLTNDAFTTVHIDGHCIEDLAARPKETKVGLTWTHDGSAQYRILRSSRGPSIGFELIGVTTSTFSTFTDYNAVMNTDYWYRVESGNNCGSYAMYVNSQGRVRNKPPVISSLPVTEADEGVVYTYDVEAQDPEGTALKYYLDEAPTGMAIGLSSGVISWTPGLHQAGMNNVLVRVSDARLASATQFFRVNVTPRPNLPPAAAISGPAMGLTGSAVTFDASGSTDPENDLPLSFTWSFGDGNTAIGATVSHTYTGTATYVVTVFVTDARGATGNGSHTIIIDAPNHPPVAIPGGPYTGQAGQTLTFDGSASHDPDGDALIYTWNFGDDTPESHDAVATHAFASAATYFGTFSVDDQRGGQHAAEVVIVITPANHPPTAALSAPLTFGNAGDEFAFNASGSTDPDGDVLLFNWNFGDASAMSGESVTHVFSNPGMFTVSLFADDQRGGADTAMVIIHINAPPIFTSTPPASTLEDDLFQYQAAASDDDGDAIAFSLLEGPAGMSLGTQSGLLTWTPDNALVGDHAVRLQVDDGRGRTAVQAFTLRVLNVNDAPQITSTPPPQAQAGVLYVYQVSARDDDAGDVITFSLIKGSGNAVVDLSTGRLSWTPAPEEAGQVALAIRATDGSGAFDEQVFTVGVQLNPQPPVFSSTPIAQAVEDQLYFYQATAEDPNGDALSFSLAAGPAGMTVSPQGLVEWTPVNEDVGTIQVSIAVTDGQFAVNQDFPLTVMNTNDAPVITSSPVVFAIAGAEYRYQAIAQDPDGDPLAYALTTAPAGMSIDAAGLITWPDDGQRRSGETVVLEVSDGNGAAASQTWTVTIDNQSVEPPIVTLILSLNMIDVGETVNIQATAASTIAISSLNVTIGGVSVLLDVNGIGQYTGQTSDFFDVTATAVDARGQTGTAIKQLMVGDPADNTPPSIALADGNCFDVYENRGMNGSVSDAGGAYYELQYRPQNGGAWTSFASGYGPVTNASLGEFDPTLLKNGVYDIQLYAYDPSGNISTLSTCAMVDGGLKVGQLNFAVNDLSLAAQGFPVSLVREYDTRVTGGDFGPGWNLANKSVAVTRTDTLGAGWAQQSSGGMFRTYFLVPRQRKEVVIRFSDTDVDRFQMKLTPATSVLIPYESVYPSVSFEAMPGTEGGLIALDQDAQCIYNGTSLYTFDLDVYNPQRFRVTRRDGSIYILHLQNGMESVTDPDGNTVTYGNDGISHSSGVSISFERGTGNRIEAATDPLGRRIEYHYDAEGNLEKVLQKGQSGLERVMAQYGYARMFGGIPKLSDVTAPDGAKLGQFEYDTQGRVTGMVDPDGNRVLYSTDFAARIQRITDRLGNETVYQFDGKGNITQKTDALGLVTRWDYNADGHMTREELPNGAVTQKTYNASGDVLTETDALGQNTSYTYDGKGNVLTVQDALGNVSQNNYDTDGRLTRTVNASGTVSALFEYDGSGNMSRFTDAAGVPRGFTYDAHGNQTGSSQAWVNPDNGGDIRNIATLTEYDGAGRMTRNVDPQGNETLSTYDEAGNLIESTDKLGNVTHNVYDANNNLIGTRYPDGTITLSVYDAAKRVVAASDRHVPGTAAIGTRSTYDAEGRMVLTERMEDLAIDIDSTGAHPVSRIVSVGALISQTSNVYDALGRLESTTGPDGQTTAYAYDVVGNRVAVVDALGNRTEFEYDLAGRQTLMRDALGREVRYVYDALGRLIRTQFPDGSFTSTQYNALGQRIAETDQAGKTRNFEYDAIGRLTAVVLPEVHDPQSGTDVRPRYEYRYSDYGTLLTILDPKGRPTDFIYDEFNRQLSRTLPLGQTEQQSYDIFGRLSRKVDFKGQAIEFTYDGLGRMVQKGLFTAGATSPSETVAFEYDALGRQQRITDSRGPTEFTYNSHGHLTGVNSPEGLVEYAYDAATGRKTRTRTDNTETAFGYDVLGRLETVSLLKRDGAVLSSPEVTTYGYTEVGSRAAVELPNGITTQYAYNSLNRLTSMAHLNAASQVIGSFSYTLAPDGRRSGVNEVLLQSNNNTLDTQSVNYTYDDLNRLTREVGTDPDGNGYTGAYEYDLVGNRLERTVQVGSQIMATTYAYDDNDRLLMEQNALTSGALYEKQKRYGFTGVGSLGQGSAYGGPLAGGSLLQNLIRKAGTLPWAMYGLIAVLSGLVLSFLSPLMATTARRTGRLWRLTLHRRDSWAGAFLLFMRLCLTGHLFYHHRSPVFTTVGSFSRCVSVALSFLFFIGFNNIEVMAQEVSLYQQLQATDWARQGTTIAYQYDENGSVVRKITSGLEDEDIVYAYNLENRLASMSRTYDDLGDLTLEATEYVYNQDGIRVKSRYTKRVNGILTEDETKLFLVDAYNHTGYAQVLEEKAAPSSRPTVTYTIGDDVLTQSKLGTVSHLFYDGHGSTRQLTSGAGAVTDIFSYDAYGVMLGGNPDRANPPATSMLYSGEQFDQDLQNYYLRARYYDQQTGRFNRMDPFEGIRHDPISFHKYAYAGLDPVNSIDPLGLFSLTELMQTVRIIGDLASQAILSGLRIISTVARTMLSILRLGFNAIMSALRFTSSRILQLLEKGIVIARKAGTGGWQFRILKLRGPVGRRSLELLNWRNILRLEAHPIHASWPSWIFYPHGHLDILGGSLSKLHIPVVEIVVLGMALYQLAVKILGGEEPNGDE